MPITIACSELVSEVNACLPFAFRRADINSLRPKVPVILIKSNMNYNRYNAASVAYLGEITGKITNDEVLGNIFKYFCIGK